MTKIKSGRKILGIFKIKADICRGSKAYEFVEREALQSLCDLVKVGEIGQAMDDFLDDYCTNKCSKRRDSHWKCDGDCIVTYQMLATAIKKYIDKRIKGKG